jgi:hypothetical protein
MLGWRRLMTAFLPMCCHGLAETDRGGGLAFAQRRGGDGRDDDVLRLRPIAELLDGLELDLGQIVAVLLEQVRADTHLRRDVVQRCQRCSAGDLEVGRERHGTPLWLCEARTVEIVAGALSAGHYTMIPPDGTDPRCGLRVATAELSKKAGRHSGQRYAASRDRHLAA